MSEIKKFINFDREVSSEAFFHAIEIYLKKPQVVNRKLNAVKNTFSAKISADHKVLFEILQKSLKQVNGNDKLDIKLNEVLQSNGVEYEIVKLEDELSHLNRKLVVLDKIIPRNCKTHRFCYQYTVICRQTNSVSFYAINDSSKLLPVINYTIQLDDNKLMLLVDPENIEADTNWLEFVLLKKLNNWMESYDGDDNAERIESHSLINDENYSVLYADLKAKYGKKFEEIWTEEVTDPKKFIYEDIAIASYLLLLWKGEKVKFVDFGCGNGLLVAILCMEGHQGYGIDIRRRKIWDKFDPKIDLRQETWNPDSDSLENVDWVIGNHSDELSPWVPVVAARNSFSCNYFLLPCCAFEFSGAKFQRKGYKKSLYMSFIDYLLEISSVCGFKSTLVDRLKIPSTKRICLIGIDRSYEKSQINEFNDKIQTLIDSSKKTFVPREKEQAVRNCTKLDRTLTDRIVRTIFDALLSEQKSEEGNEWNVGNEMDLSDAVKLISQEDLKKLKSENGGLQTLLKNKHQIFELHGGKLKIRKPKRISERTFSSKKVFLKSSPCYFHLHHKQGCLLKDEECCFKH